MVFSKEADRVLKMNDYSSNLPKTQSSRQRRALRLVLTVILTLIWTTVVYATGPGDLDTTFNGTGVVTTSIDSGSIVFSVAVQPDGKIVAAGQSFSQGSGNFAVARYESDGDLDLTFKGTGIVTTPISSMFDFNPYLAIQPDGKIVLAGASGTVDKAGFAVVRYKSDGDLDPTFNATGIVTTAITAGADVGRSIALQPDGKIVVAGDSSRGSFISDFAIVRYESSGKLDSTFNGTGVVTTSIGNSASGRSVAIQPDGKIVVAGFTERSVGDYDFAVTRLRT